MVLRVIDGISSATAGSATEDDGTGSLASSAPEPLSSFHDIPILEGELFLLPGGTPHNPIRFADTVGIVVELSRPEGVRDRLRWYCQGCRRVVSEVEIGDLKEGLKGAVRAFAEDEGRRMCRGCGVICEVVPSGVVRPD